MLEEKKNCLEKLKIIFEIKKVEVAKSQLFLKFGCSRPYLPKMVPLRANKFGFETSLHLSPRNPD